MTTLVTAISNYLVSACALAGVVERRGWVDDRVLIRTSDAQELFMKMSKSDIGYIVLLGIVTAVSISGCGQNQAAQTAQSNQQALAQLKAQQQTNPVTTAQQTAQYSNYINQSHVPQQYKAQSIANMQSQVAAYNASLHH